MATYPHDVFQKPADVNIPIWRYMDFTKFVSMLENGGLYLARADKLGDPFEGSYSRGNEKQRPDIYKDDRFKNLKPALSAITQYMRYRAFVNCWHMNEHESAAMWNLYTKSNEAIVIRSTFQKLENVLDSSCFLGTVSYIDYENEWLPEGNILYPFVHKRLSFRHEQEVRVVVQENPDGHDFFKVPPDSINIGMWKNVNLLLLIDAVYVAPSSPAWFHTLVQQVITRYELDKPVIQSTLDKEPFF